MKEELDALREELATRLADLKTEVKRKMPAALEEENLRLREALKSAHGCLQNVAGFLSHCSHDICMCGDSERTHRGYSNNHQFVSSFDYYLPSITGEIQGTISLLSRSLNELPQRVPELRS